MSNIKNAFLDGKAFIPFITCGDPDLDTTYEVVCAAAKNGADLIELGIPFSDPTAEGPVIMKRCSETGVDGVILPDVPFEEKDEFAETAKQYKIDFISLIAPTSDNRISQIAKEAEGFIYVVSSLGVTGTRSEITTNIQDIVKTIRANTTVPCAVGFGISTPEQAANMAAKIKAATIAPW